MIDSCEIGGVFEDRFSTDSIVWTTKIDDGEIGRDIG